MMAKWTAADIPGLLGVTAVVTGTGGLGLEDALELAKAGANVMVAGRSAKKGADAIAIIKNAFREARICFEELDLASLQSIEQFASRLQSSVGSVDILINNAGVMMPPTQKTTQDGFELQLGTNYLGHFALTARLLPLLRKSGNARVVSLSSLAARRGKINFTDLQYEHRYNAMAAYGQSKLACLIFARELQKRSEAGKWGVSSFGAHPGLASTDLMENGPGSKSGFATFGKILGFLFQSPAQGALPTLFAATSPAAKPGEYYGPDGFGGTKGYPTIAPLPPGAREATTAALLWEVSERLTGVSYVSAAAGLT